MQAARQKNSLGKFVTFLLANIVGGLVQLWVLYLILVTQSKNPDLHVLLGDGGLFFFATSLTFNSFLALVEKNTLRPGTSDLNVSRLMHRS